MMPFAALAISTNLLTVAAGGVPNLNVAPSCNAAAIAGMAVAGRTTESCLNDEHTARDQLTKDWNNYSASDKSHCLSLVSTGGGASYVELLSCLEMSRDARQLADDRSNPQTSTSQTPTRSRRR
jgi:hypothetical protein